MMLHLMNSAMMPQEGAYNLLRIDADQAKKVFQEAGEDWVSYIGYPNTCHVLSRLFETEIPLSRQETVLEDGDLMLCVQLVRRVQIPREKGLHKFGEKLEDYKFSLVKYSKKC